jgi:hypothetical protein
LSAKDGNNKSAKTRSKKLNTAPWEAQDFASVKVEMVEETTINFDRIDELPSKIDEPPSEIALDRENHDLPMYHEGIFGDRYVDFQEPLAVRRQFHFSKVILMNLCCVGGTDFLVSTTAFASCAGATWPSLHRSYKFARSS